METQVSSHQLGCGLSQDTKNNRETRIEVCLSCEYLASLSHLTLV